MVIINNLQKITNFLFLFQIFYFVLLKIRNCSSCTFFLLTPSSPILLSGCDNIKFAPFNSYYPNIDEDANASGLTSALNLWDKPIVVAPNHHSGGAGGGSASSSLQNHHHWSLMDPAEFSLLAVPVDSLPPKGQHNTSELVNRANVTFSDSIFSRF